MKLLSFLHKICHTSSIGERVESLRDHGKILILDAANRYQKKYLFGDKWFEGS